MFGDTRAGPGTTVPRGFFLIGLLGSRAPRSVGAWRALFVAVWLIYVVHPLNSLFRHHYGVLYIAGAVAIAAVYCAVFFFVIAAARFDRVVPLPWRN
jgi:hypothetical protein